MPSQVTFTGDLGPGLAVTGKVFTYVTKLELDIARNVLGIYQEVPQEFPRVTWVSMDGVTTFTVTAASGVYTVVIS